MVGKCTENQPKHMHFHISFRCRIFYRTAGDPGGGGNSGVFFSFFELIFFFNSANTLLCFPYFFPKQTGIIAAMIHLRSCRRPPHPPGTTGWFYTLGTPSFLPGGKTEVARRRGAWEFSGWSGLTFLLLCLRTFALFNDFYNSRFALLMVRA